MTEIPEGQAEVQEARAAHDAAVDRWEASLGNAHPDEVEASYQAMADAGARLAEVADAYPAAWWAAEEAWVAAQAGPTEPGTPEPEAEA